PGRLARRRRRGHFLVRLLPDLPRRRSRPGRARHQVQGPGRALPGGEPHRRPRHGTGLPAPVRHSLSLTERHRRRRRGRHAGCGAAAGDAQHRGAGPQGPRGGPGDRADRALHPADSDRGIAGRAEVIAASSWAQDLAEVIFSGSLLAAAPIALVAGFISFASPCVLPLVPGYLGYLGGMVGADPAGKGSGSRARLVLGVLGFVAGFTAVFTIATMALTSIGLTLFRWQDVITRVLGVVVILMGVAFLGAMPFLQRERRLRVSPRAGVWGAPLLGIVFGFGWAPCIGPTLAAVQSLAIGGADP